jgi:hypothetical protein
MNLPGARESPTPQLGHATFSLTLSSDARLQSSVAYCDSLAHYLAAVLVEALPRRCIVEIHDLCLGKGGVYHAGRSIYTKVAPPLAALLISKDEIG